MSTTKICRSCDPPTEKPLSAFYKGSSRCKVCESKAHKKYYAKKKKRAIHRKSNYKILYGITIEDFNQMFEEQQGACKICRRVGVPLVVDHDHKTGKKRALLCSACNHGLGRFRDDAVVMQRAVDYLKEFTDG